MNIRKIAVSLPLILTFTMRLVSASSSLAAPAQPVFRKDVTAGALSGQMVVEIKEGEGLSPAEKVTLPKDLVTGLTKRLQERLKECHVALTGSGPKWVFTSEIIRLPALGNYIWTARLCREEGPTREIARQWVGAANSHLSLSFYRGTAHIDIDGLVGEMAQRAAHAMLDYEPNPNLRCLREMQAISTEVTDQNLQKTVLQTEFALRAGQSPQLIVKGQKAGKFWLITVEGGKASLSAEPGFDLNPGKPTSISYTPGAEKWILLRINHPVFKLQRDARGPQGDEFVSIIEMRPGYGDANSALLNLLDRMYREGSSLWYLKRLPTQAAP